MIPLGAQHEERCDCNDRRPDGAVELERLTGDNRPEDERGTRQRSRNPSDADRGLVQTLHPGQLGVLLH